MPPYILFFACKADVSDQEIVYEPEVFDAAEMLKDVGKLKLSDYGFFKMPFLNSKMTMPDLENPLKIVLFKNLNLILIDDPKSQSINVYVFVWILEGKINLVLPYEINAVYLNLLFDSTLTDCLACVRCLYVYFVSSN